jgi:hypothetical protein
MIQAPIWRVERGNAAATQAFQVFLLLAVHLAGAAAGLETRQPFEAILEV